MNTNNRQESIYIAGIHSISFESDQATLAHLWCIDACYGRYFCVHKIGLKSYTLLRAVAIRH